MGRLGSRLVKRDRVLDHAVVGTLYSLCGWVCTFQNSLSRLPFTFRLRQCIAEFNLSKDPADRRRHLLNALKYTTAFPVVFTTYWINWQRRHYRKSELDLDQGASWNLHVAVALWCDAQT